MRKGRRTAKRRTEGTGNGDREGSSVARGQKPTRRPGRYRWAGQGSAVANGKTRWSRGVRFQRIAILRRHHFREGVGEASGLGEGRSSIGARVGWGSSLRVVASIAGRPSRERSLKGRFVRGIGPAGDYPGFRFARSQELEIPGSRFGSSGFIRLGDRRVGVASRIAADSPQRVFERGEVAESLAPTEEGDAQMDSLLSIPREVF